MSDTAPVQPASPATTRDQTDYEALVEQLLVEINRLNEQMQSDRADIACLKQETSALKAETRALLVGLGAQL